MPSFEEQVATLTAERDEAQRRLILAEALGVFWREKAESARDAALLAAMGGDAVPLIPESHSYGVGSSIEVKAGNEIEIVHPRDAPPYIRIVPPEEVAARHEAVTPAEKLAEQVAEILRDLSGGGFCQTGTSFVEPPEGGWPEVYFPTVSFDGTFDPVKLLKRLRPLYDRPPAPGEGSVPDDGHHFPNL